MQKIYLTATSWFLFVGILALNLTWCSSVDYGSDNNEDDDEFLPKINWMTFSLDTSKMNRNISIKDVQNCINQYYVPIKPFVSPGIKDHLEQMGQACLVFVNDGSHAYILLNTVMSFYKRFGKEYDIVVSGAKYRKLAKNDKRREELLDQAFRNLLIKFSDIFGMAITSTETIIEEENVTKRTKAEHKKVLNEQMDQDRAELQDKSTSSSPPSKLRSAINEFNKKRLLIRTLGSDDTGKYQAMIRRAKKMNEMGEAVPENLIEFIKYLIVNPARITYRINTDQKSGNATNVIQAKASALPSKDSTSHNDDSDISKIPTKERFNDREGKDSKTIHEKDFDKSPKDSTQLTNQSLTNTSNTKNSQRSFKLFVVIMCVLIILTALLFIVIITVFSVPKTRSISKK